MWPKALLELAPHLLRLVPLADRSQTNRTAEDEAHLKAMEELAERLRDDLGHVSASHAGLYRQLNEQSEQMVGIAAAVEMARLSVESAEGRVARLQRKVVTNTKLLAAALVMNFVLLLLVVVLLVRH
jgi:hypothetical protein